MALRIGIIDYGMGNLRSVAGAVSHLGHEALVSADPDVLCSAERLILPGVGAFGDAMANLKARGLTAVLNDLVIQKRRPILGICLGAQLMCKESQEFGLTVGLGWLPATVRRIGEGIENLRIPHVGWDDLECLHESPLFRDIPPSSLYYYVHSFCIKAQDQSVVVGECLYGERFAAALVKDNIAAVQFHPEKSQQAGLRLLSNFIERH